MDQRSKLIRHYLDMGFYLIPIPYAQKSPIHKGWNLKENCIRDEKQLDSNSNVGLAHAYSRTMCLDIDDYKASKDYFLKTYNIDLYTIVSDPLTVSWSSGRKNSIKLLFRLENPLHSKKIISNGSCLFEFRCAANNGLTIQDVLPPSVHPSFQNYKFINFSENVPFLPSNLLEIWKSLLDIKESNTGSSQTTWEEIQNCLTYINADCSRDEWIRIGMAIHSHATSPSELDTAFKLWDRWSQAGQKYPGYNNILNQFKSFNSSKTTMINIQTLFYIARNHGYTTDFSNIFPKEGLSPTFIVGSKPVSPNLDISLFPPQLSAQSVQISNAIGCDPLVPLWSGLAAVCAVVDSRMSYEILPGFKVPPILWLMTIGDPSDKKTPGSKPMLSYLKFMEKNLLGEYYPALKLWEAQEASHASAKKAYLQYASSHEYLLDPTSLPEVPELPPQPVPTRFTVTDITSQALVRDASNRPRGLLCYLDEMNSWVKKITNPLSGEDRSTWVVSYEGDYYEMDRVSGGRIACENLAISIYGNIQPNVLKSNLDKLTEDGLLQRFIPAILRSDLTKQGNPFDHNVDCSEWNSLLKKLFDMPITTYSSSPAAMLLFRNFQTWYEDRKREERMLISTAPFMTAFGKLEGLIGRLCLVFHLIESPDNPYISASVMTRVITIVKDYIIPAYRILYEDNTYTQFFECIKKVLLGYEGDIISLSYLKIRTSSLVKKLNVQDHENLISACMEVFKSLNWVQMTKSHKSYKLNKVLAQQFATYREELKRLKEDRLIHLNETSLDEFE